MKTPELNEEGICLDDKGNAYPFVYTKKGFVNKFSTFRTVIKNVLGWKSIVDIKNEIGEEIYKAKQGNNLD